MLSHTWKHLSNTALARELADAIRDDRVSKAKLLGLIAEAQTRKLHLPAAYSSMFTYCVGEFGLTRDVAYKLIRAARAVRRFPGILVAVEKGRLTVAAVVLLAPHLNSGNAAELLSVSEGKTRGEVRALLESRGLIPPSQFHRPGAMTVNSVPSTPQPLGTSVPPGTRTDPLSAPDAARVAEEASWESVTDPRATMSCDGQELAPGPVADEGAAPAAVEGLVRLELTLDQESRDLLHRAQDLMGHQVPSGDPSEIFKRALVLLVKHLEKQKFAATDSPRAKRASKNPRHIPAHVKRAVRERDHDQCTFVGDTGRRCEATRFLEFDHDLEVARGGEATVANTRLRCRAHNQFTAERTFGEGFMQGKRELAKAKAAARRARRFTRESEDSMRAAARERALEEIPWLGEMTRRGTEAIASQADPEPPPLPS